MRAVFHHHECTALAQAWNHLMTNLARIHARSDAYRAQWKAELAMNNQTPEPPTAPLFNASDPPVVQIPLAEYERLLTIRKASADLTASIADLIASIDPVINDWTDRERGAFLRGWTAGHSAQKHP